MRFVILGAGGIGSVVAAHLARAGHRVTLVARGAHLEAVQERGLEVRGLARFRVSPEAVESATGECDVLVLATKTNDTPQALRAVEGLRPQAALSLQNGVLKDDVLAAAFGRPAVLGATTMLGATRSAPGVVDFTLDGPTVAGELAGPPSARLARLAEAWNASGLRLQAVDDIAAHEWAKQALQAAMAPLSVLTNRPAHLIWGTPALAGSLVTMVREAAAVAAALGIELSHDAAYGFDMAALAGLPVAEATGLVLARGAEVAAAGRTEIVISMLQDVRAGRPTEIEETVGHVVRLAGGLGVAVPVLAFACEVVRGIEAANRG